MTTEVTAEAERLQDIGAWVKIDPWASDTIQWPKAKRPATLPPADEGFANWCEGLNDAVYNAPSANASPRYNEGYAAGLSYLQARHYVRTIEDLIEGV